MLGLLPGIVILIGAFRFSSHCLMYRESDFCLLFDDVLFHRDMTSVVDWLLDVKNPVDPRARRLHMLFLCVSHTQAQGQSKSQINPRAKTYKPRLREFYSKNVMP